jgi:hypothetical protein
MLNTLRCKIKEIYMQIPHHPKNTNLLSTLEIQSYEIKIHHLPEDI